LRSFNCIRAHQFIFSCHVRFMSCSTPRTRCIIGTYLVTSSRHAFTFPISAFLYLVNSKCERWDISVIVISQRENMITCEKVSQKWNRFYRSVAQFLGNTTSDTENSAFLLVFTCIVSAEYDCQMWNRQLRSKLIRVYLQI